MKVFNKANYAICFSFTGDIIPLNKLAFLFFYGNQLFTKLVLMQKIEHIGIAVKDIEESNKLFAKLLNTAHYKMEEVESEGVITSFFKIGEVKIELLQATNEQSAIHQFVEKKGEGIHHIAFAVEDVNAELTRLKNEGFEAIHEKAKDGADGKVIAFLHPKSTNRVLTEICADQ